MPHVTTFRFKALPGKEDAVVATFEKWANKEQMKATGVIEYWVSASNDAAGEFEAYVCFDTTENYKKNSDRPEQGVWFQEFRALLQDDPEWFNGTIAIAVDSTD